MKKKKSVHRSHPRYSPCPNYPNQATNDYYMQKVLDVTAGIVSGVGLVLSLLFFVSMM